MVDGRIVFRQGERERVGRELAQAIGKVWEREQHPDHGIGELVTNDADATATR